MDSISFSSKARVLMMLVVVVVIIIKPPYPPSTLEARCDVSGDWLVEVLASVVAREAGKVVGHPALQVGEAGVDGGCPGKHLIVAVGANEVSK